MRLAWGRGFFRIWVLLSAIWISGVIWIESNPPVQNGPPPFDETLPYLKTVPGVKMDKRSDCEPAAKQDPRVDLQNCIDFYNDNGRSEQIRRYVRSVAWAIVPPLALLLFGSGVGWVIRGFCREF